MGVLQKPLISVAAAWAKAIWYIAYFLVVLDRERMFIKITCFTLNQLINRTVCSRHQCAKTTVLNSHRCLIDAGVEKMNNI
jgi:hypothetical protein